MKGYFAELARHTGLKTGITRTVETSAASQPRAQPEAERPAPGIEVDEVTFVSPPQSPAESSTVAGPATVESTSANATALVPDRGDAERTDHASDNRHAESDVQSSAIRTPSITIVESEVATIASGSASEILPSAPTEAGNPGQPRVVISEPVSLETPTSSSGELREHDSARDPLRKISTSEPTRSPDLDHETGAVAIEEKILEPLLATAQPGDFKVEDPIQRQLIVRNYLKEVTEWISTPATVEDEAPSVGSAEPLEGATNAASDFHRPVSSPNQLRETPEEEGLSLSIGTIKIVIEEPRTSASAVASSPPAQTERTVAASSPASIDLSRYYLTRW